MLDHLVIAREQKSTAPVRRGRPAFAKKEGDNVSMTELWKTLSHGTDRIFKSAGGGSDDVLLNDGELDTFIENMMRGETDCATEEPSIINKDNFRASDETENLSDLRVSGVSTIFDFAGTNDANQKAPDIAEQGYDSEDIRAAVNNSPADITDTKSVLNGEGFVSMENYVAEVENMDEDVQYVDSEVHVKKRARLETKRYLIFDGHELC